MHHAYSDTEKDPHSPLNHSNCPAMMWATKRRYDDFAYRREGPRRASTGDIRSGRRSIASASRWVARLVWVALYTAFYVAFATAPWLFCCLPLHFVMGPIHGAIVNWCGHKYGYQNFDNGDDSRNTLVVRLPDAAASCSRTTTTSPAMSPNFAARWFEIDPAFQVMRLLGKLGIIELPALQPAAARG